MTSPAPLLTADTDVLVQHAVQARMAQARLARHDPCEFLRFVLRDEETGDRVETTMAHEEWQALISLHPRLVLWSHVESGKTAGVCVGRVLFELGRNPSLRVAIVSNTAGQSTKIIRTLAQYIEHSAELHEVFPDLLPGRRQNDQWTAGAITVQRPPGLRDPSVQAFGLHGNILGARIDLLIIDDILDYENTRTPHMRDDVWRWVHSTLFGRLTRQSRVTVIGNAWHPEDFMHRLAKQGVWDAYKYPAITANGTSIWPSRWDDARIAQKRAELGPLEFARQMLCEARADSESRFKQDWIRLCMDRGEGRRLAHWLHTVPRGYRVVTGVDLGVSRRAGSALTVLFTIAVHPNDDREILCVEAGKWTAPDIVNRIVDVHRRYKSTVFVENVAAQDFLVQFTRYLTNVPVKPFTTDRRKHHPEFGVESIGAELARGQWIIPSEHGKCHPEIEAWLNEMLYYEPGAHTGDRLMASWIAREGARAGNDKAQVRRANLLYR